MKSIETFKKYKEEKKKLKEEKRKTGMYKKPKLKRSKIKKVYSPTGEKDLFLEIRNERKHNCVVCGKYIHEAKAYCFAHLLPKGTYPKYRLNKLNICIVCSIACHHRVDNCVVGYKRIIKENIDQGKVISFNL